MARRGPPARGDGARAGAAAAGRGTASSPAATSRPPRSSVRRAAVTTAAGAEYVELTDEEFMQTTQSILNAALEEAICVFGIEAAVGEPSVTGTQDIEPWIDWVNEQLGYHDLVAIIRAKGLALRIGNKRAKVMQILKYIVAYNEE
jgi:hypothetical protein